MLSIIITSKLFKLLAAELNNVNHIFLFHKTALNKLVGVLWLLQCPARVVTFTDTLIVGPIIDKNHNKSFPCQVIKPQCRKKRNNKLKIRSLGYNY